MLTQSLCFLFYFIWVFAYEKRTGKKSHSIFMLFVCQAKDVENERKFSPFTHSTSNGLHPHTSRKNFLSSDLIDVGNFILEIFFRSLFTSWDFVMCSTRKKCQHFIPNIDLIILKFERKLSSFFVDIFLQHSVQVFRYFSPVSTERWSESAFIWWKITHHPFWGAGTGKWMEKLMDKKWGLLYLWWFFYFTPEILCSLHIFSLSCCHRWKMFRIEGEADDAV